VHDRFGWHRDGYLGRLRQVNTWTASGHEFFAEHRLLRYLREPAAGQAVDASDRHALERLCDRSPQLIPAMPAVLTHGDLWAGNLLSRDGRITVIDPAVSWRQPVERAVPCWPRRGGCAGCLRRCLAGQDLIQPVERDLVQEAGVASLAVHLGSLVLGGEDEPVARIGQGVEEGAGVVVHGLSLARR
jgi:hypothetical protein